MYKFLVGVLKKKICEWQDYSKLRVKKSKGQKRHMKGSVYISKREKSDSKTKLKGEY